MKIIISGASGFVGQNFISYLKNKHLGEVQAINLRQPLPHTLPLFTSMIHLAGKAHDLKNTSVAQEYFDVNYSKTKEIFDLFLKSEGRDFIYFSSVKAVADSINNVLDENANSNPQTPYGKSKLKAEEYILSHRLPQNKRVFILRPCMIHGPGNKGNLNLLYQFVKKGVPYPLAAFDNLRSFLSIANLNYLLEEIISRPDIPGGVYNIADDVPLSTNEVIEIISDVNNSKAKFWRISPALIRSLATVGDKLHLPLNSERLKKLTESYIVSNQKIKDALNIKSLPTTSVEGLRATIKSFDSN